MHDVRIQAIAGFLSRAECAALLDTIHAAGFEEQYAGDGRLLRSRAQFEDPGWADLIWQRLRPAIPPLTEMYSDDFLPEPRPKAELQDYRAVQLNERFRCYRYGSTEEFRRHQDFAHEYSASKRTFYTVLIYLNDDFRGGETAFDGFTVHPETGLLVLFPHELEHEGRRIETGIKYSLRTDVVFEASGE